VNVQLLGPPTRYVRAWCTRSDCEKSWNSDTSETNRRFARLHAVGTGHEVEVIEETKSRFGPSSAPSDQEIEVRIYNNGVEMKRHGDSNGH
jgi:hypothetical protein